MKNARKNTTDETQASYSVERFPTVVSKHESDANQGEGGGSESGSGTPDGEGGSGGSEGGGNG